MSEADKMSEEEIIKECEELANNAYHELGNCWDEEYSREAICGLLDLYNKAKAKLTEYEKQLDLDYVDENYVRKELYNKEKEIRIKEAIVISQLRQENQNQKEKLQMYIPRRRVRRVYKMLGKILRTDIDPVILEKELKEEVEEK